jgi:hypothetical protein
MTDDNTVYIAEAYKDGERIERVVHTNHADAKEDIDVLTFGENPDRVEITEERLYLGDDDVAVFER